MSVRRKSPDFVPSTSSNVLAPREPPVTRPTASFSNDDMQYLRKSLEQFNKELDQRSQATTREARKSPSSAAAEQAQKGEASDPASSREAAAGIQSQDGANGSACEDGDSILKKLEALLRQGRLDKHDDVAPPPPIVNFKA